MGVFLFEQIGDTFVKIFPGTWFFVEDSLLPPLLSLFIPSSDMSISNNPPSLQSLQVHIIVVRLISQTVKTVCMQKQFCRPISLLRFDDRNWYGVAGLRLCLHHMNSISIGIKVWTSKFGFVQNFEKFCLEIVRVTRVVLQRRTDVECYFLDIVSFICSRHNRTDCLS